MSFSPMVLAMDVLEPPNFWIMGWVSTTVLPPLARKIVTFSCQFLPGTNDVRFQTPNLQIVGWVLYHCATTAGQENRNFYPAISSPRTNDGRFQPPQLLDNGMSFYHCVQPLAKKIKYICCNFLPWYQWWQVSNPEAVDSWMGFLPLCYHPGQENK